MRFATNNSKVEDKEQAAKDTMESLRFLMEGEKRAAQVLELFDDQASDQEDGEDICIEVVPPSGVPCDFQIWDPNTTVEHAKAAVLKQFCPGEQVTLPPKFGLFFCFSAAKVKLLCVLTENSNCAAQVE